MGKTSVEETPRRVLYLDLDGTVRHGKDELGHFVNAPKDVVLFPETLPLLKRYKRMNYRIVAVSNQGGIALGHFTMADCLATMTRTQELCQGMFDKMIWCSHHPDAKDLEYARCWCRKPRIGLIVEACLAMGRQFHEYYPPHLALFVGDREEDRQCAENANIDFMWAAEWRALAHLPQTFTVS